MSRTMSEQEEPAPSDPLQHQNAEPHQSPSSQYEESSKHGPELQDTAEEEAEDNVDKGWAWVIVVCAFYTNFMAAGTFMCFGALYVELLDYFPDTRSVASLVASVCGISFAVSGAVSSYTSTRFSHRVTAIIGGFLVTTGLLVSGFAPNIQFLMVSFGVLVGGGCGLTWITLVVAVTGYFRHKRGIAQAIAFCGGGLSYMVFPFFYRIVTEHYAWRGTMWTMASMWAQTFIVGALLRPLPIRPGRSDRSSHKTLSRKWSLYLFLLGHFCFQWDMVTFVNILPDAGRLAGHSTYLAGLLITILGVPIIPLRLVGNIITDRGLLSPPLYFTILCAFMAATAFLLPLYDAYWYMALVAALRGSTMAIMVPLATVVCADVFRAERMTAAYGFVVVADGVAGLLAPALAGTTYDLTGSYSTVLIITGCVSLCSMALNFFVYLYRIGRLGRKDKPLNVLQMNPLKEPVDDGDSLHYSREVVSKPICRSLSSLGPSLGSRILLNEMASREEARAATTT